MSRDIIGPAERNIQALWSACFLSLAHNGCPPVRPGQVERTVQGSQHINGIISSSGSPDGISTNSLYRVFWRALMANNSQAQRLLPMEDSACDTNDGCGHILGPSLAHIITQLCVLAPISLSKPVLQLVEHIACPSRVKHLLLLGFSIISNPVPWPLPGSGHPAQSVAGRAS